jgi:CcmD family protein
MFASAVGTTDAAALQATGLGSQTLRPYWHVFIAYAVVIILIGAWAFSISRRLKNVEDRLVD